MYRTQALRAARVAKPRAAVPRSSRRAYASGGPLPGGAPGAPPGTEAPKSGSSNAILIATIALAAGAGAYWYFGENPDQAARLKAKAIEEENQVQRGISDATAAARNRADTGYKQGQKTYDDLKSETRAKFSTAEERAKGAATDAQKTLDSYKNRASQSISEVRGSTENLYKDARDTTGQKTEEAKEGWFSWLGWGKSKAVDSKKAAASKAAKTAESARISADKRA